MRVFRDLDNLRPGNQFPRAIRNAISSAGVALVVIGPAWVTINDSRGIQRLIDPTDFVRIEIETALWAGIPIVPVLVYGAVFPESSAIPESIRPMLKRQAALIRSDQDFDQDMDRIIQTLDHLLQKSERFADARELANFMSELSEDCFHAGWLDGWEYVLWNSLVNSLEGGYPLGKDCISKRDHSRLWRLKEACGGWIIWVEDHGRRFVPIEVWEKHLAAAPKDKWRDLHKSAVNIFEE